jgi:uncharacterized protein YjdB
MTKYCSTSSYGFNGFTDGKTVLDSEDDAAHVNLGGNWRMPTKDEQDELQNNCTWKWTSMNGINGQKVTGPNGNSIFLPAAGYRYDAYYLSNESFRGRFWSSSLYPYYSYDAYYLDFSQYSEDWIYFYGNRFGGISVRPVYADGPAVISVTSVSLNKTTLSITEGDTYTLTATVSPSNATDKSVTWSSSNTSVAVVSASGLVTAKAAGSATITVTTNDGGKKATCSVTVSNPIVSVTDVSLNKTSMSMMVGDTQTLTATITPSNATDKSVTWSSSNTSVATVSSSGLVTAKAAGSATITVTTNDGGKKATCLVTVQAQTVLVTGVSLNKTSLSMTVGDTQTLTATVAPSNATDKSVTWSSSNTSVATVSSSGLVTAKAAGAATITVMTNDGSKTANCFVSVIASPIGDDAVFVKIASINDLVDGKYLIVNEAAGVAMTDAVDVAGNKIAVTISGNKIAATTETQGVAFTFTAINGAFQGANGMYLAHSGASNGIKPTDSPSENTVTFSEGDAVIKASDDYFIQYNMSSGQERFRYYKNAQPDGAVQLYKLVNDGDTPPMVVTLEYITLAGQTTEYIVGDAFSFDGTVTAHYSDGSTLIVTPTDVSRPDMSTAGTKEVIVTYTRGTMSATAKYFIIVSDLVIGNDPVFVKITSLSELVDGKYLIVNKTASVAMSDAVDEPGNSIPVTISGNKIAATTATRAVAFTFTATNGAFQGANGKYLAHSGTKNSINPSETPVENTILFSEGDAIISALDNYFIQYNKSGGQERFRYYKNTQSDGAVQLYKLVNDGG